MELKIIKLKRINIFFKDLPKKLAERSFLMFSILLIIALALGGLVFYFYVFLVQSSLELSVNEKPLETQEKNYQNILNEWRERDEKLLQADSKEYPNLFKFSPPPATSTPTSTEELTE